MKAFQGTVTILNLDSAAHTAGVAIDGPISKNAATHALQLIRFLRPDNDELTVYLNSSGGDVSAAIELGEEVRKLSVLDSDRRSRGETNTSPAKVHQQHHHQLLCPHCQGQQQGKRSSSLKKYSAIHVQGEAPESDDSSRDCEAKRVHLSLLAGAYSTRQSSE